MTPHDRPRLLALAGALAAAALLVALPSAADEFPRYIPQVPHLRASDCPSLVLPDGRNVVRFEEPMRSDWLIAATTAEVPFDFFGSCARVSGSGDIELTVALVADSPAAIAFLEEEPYIVQMALGGRYWSEWLRDPDDEERAFLGLYHREHLGDFLTHAGLLEASRQDEVADYITAAMADIRFVWTLRRRTEHPCSMTMFVSGDASGEHTGDVAYYNVFEQGVAEGAAAGTWADPVLQDMLEGMIEWSAGEAAAMEDRGFPAEESATPEAARAYAEEMREWGGLTGGTDTFGLTLVDVKLDSRAPEHTESLGGAMATLAATAHVTVSGRFGETIRPQSGKALAWPIEISRVTAAAGVVDGNLDVLGYVWEPGKPGSASVVVAKQPDSSEIQGMVVAELFPDEPRPGAEGIRVVATFTAQQGAVSCQ